MNSNEYFANFQRICLSILAQSGNCDDSQTRFRAATTVPEMVSAWKHFLDGLLHEVPAQVIAAFADFYPTYRTDINRAGIYYNEAPPTDSINAIILIGDTPSSDAESSKKATVPDSLTSGRNPLSITGRHRFYVLGNCPVLCFDHCNVFINATTAHVCIYQNCRASIEAGTLYANGRSVVHGKGNITCYESTTIHLVGGTLTDHGHLDIYAYNDAVIHSYFATAPTSRRRITLKDKAVLLPLSSMESPSKATVLGDSVSEKSSIVK